MLIETFDANGKRRVIERALSVNCKFCGASLHCPPDADFWFWLKDGMVVDFKREHEAHGFPRMVGAEIRVIEKDE